MFWKKRMENQVSELEKKYAALETRYNGSIYALNTITDGILRIVEKEFDIFGDDKSKNRLRRGGKNNVNTFKQDQGDHGAVGYDAERLGPKVCPAKINCQHVSVRESNPEQNPIDRACGGFGRFA